MGNVLAITLQAMQQDAAAVEQVAMNLANAATPGYKRSMRVQQAAEMTFARLVDGANPPDTSGATAASGMFTDTRAGILKQTGQALDIAIEGRGYFEVLTPNGPAYTRQGAFHLDPGGRLVNADGHPVAGRNGEITLASSQVRISSDGAIVDIRTEESVGQLKVFSFEREEQLQRLGASLFAGNATGREAPAGEVRVRQGFLENSNVNSLAEMTRLMQSMRHFESMQRITQGYDEMLGGAIRRLGEG